MTRTGHGHAGNSGIGGDGELPHPMREQDQYMPIANVIRIMRRILPSHAKISDDAKETIQECVSEYISFVTGEANDRCQREQRKTVTAEDVLWSMGKLGLDNYVGPLSMYLHRYREIETDRGSLSCVVPPFLRQAGAEDFSHGGIGLAGFDSNNASSIGNLPFGSINYLQATMPVPLSGEYCGDASRISGTASNVASASVSASQEGYADLNLGDKLN
ncbi:hypothetical protein MLD38_010959 [Melastoma candidum]|uniref:Uncharacterized protein n=1 Tax=Melastoma candidum TaxID=119954 RepID=A0ACB9R110_9MYRT|nr:hypothetical protein MLD38_010959 [Melastoma candidum]